MKHYAWLLLLPLFCCNRQPEPHPAAPVGEVPGLPAPAKPADAQNAKPYANERFRKVTVTKTGSGTFQVKGEAQVFEARFGWDVEDGHEILASGHQMANAGAPAWGQFDFSFGVKQQRKNSRLTLVLFEVSAKDGSRQHELAVGLDGPNEKKPSE